MEQKLIITDEVNQKAVKLFLLIVLVLSAVLEGILIATGAKGLVFVVMGLPAVAALIAKRKFFREEKGALLVSKCKIKYIGLALLYPLVYIGIPYVIYWITNPGSMKLEVTPMLIGSLLVGLVVNLLPSFGEEVGWRGFLVPRLIQWIGLEKTLLLTGLIWCVWHLPLLISGLYMPGTPMWFKLPMFLIMIGAASVIFAILTLRAGSVWPAVVMHSAHNVYDQAIFATATTGDNRMYFVSETGILTVVVVVVMAVIVWTGYQRSR